MVSFFLCLALLIIGYFTYGKLVESTFGPDDRETPAVVINDGVDYVVLPQWKLFLIQLLNIAGVGPVIRAVTMAPFFFWKKVRFILLASLLSLPVSNIDERFSRRNVRKPPFYCTFLLFRFEKRFPAIIVSL